MVEFVINLMGVSDIWILFLESGIVIMVEEEKTECLIKFVCGTWEWLVVADVVVRYYGICMLLSR